MKTNRLALSVFTLWILVFLLSFLMPHWTAAIGDGFTRGWNRIGVWMQWKFAAFLIAVFSTYLAFTKLKTDTL